MKTPKPYYLTARQDDGDLPRSALKPGTEDPEIPAARIEPETGHPLPGPVTLAGDDDEATGESMNVRLTADEPEIPGATFLKKPAKPQGNADDLELPEQRFEPNTRMPRLH